MNLSIVVIKYYLLLSFLRLKVSFLTKTFIFQRTSSRRNNVRPFVKYPFTYYKYNDAILNTLNTQIGSYYSLQFFSRSTVLFSSYEVISLFSFQIKEVVHFSSKSFEFTQMLHPPHLPISTLRVHHKYICTHHYFVPIIA